MDAFILADCSDGLQLAEKGVVAAAAAAKTKSRLNETRGSVVQESAAWSDKRGLDRWRAEEVGGYGRGRVSSSEVTISLSTGGQPAQQPPLALAARTAQILDGYRAGHKVLPRHGEEGSSVELVWRILGL